MLCCLYVMPGKQPLNNNALSLLASAGIITTCKIRWGDEGMRYHVVTAWWVILLIYQLISYQYTPFFQVMTCTIGHLTITMVLYCVTLFRYNNGVITNNRVCLLELVMIMTSDKDSDLRLSIRGYFEKITNELFIAIIAVTLFILT